MAKRSPLHSSAYARFLRRLCAARKDACLTQAQVAQALDRPLSFVSKCERAERRVDFIELVAFARLYGKSLEFFTDPRD